MQKAVLRDRNNDTEVGKFAFYLVGPYSFCSHWALAFTGVYTVLNVSMLVLLYHCWKKNQYFLNYAFWGKKSLWFSSI